jgi:hypothetical protein
MLKCFNKFISLRNIGFKLSKYNILQNFKGKHFSNFEEHLRDIQLKPKYEAAISNIIIGDNIKAISFLDELLNDLKEERKENTEDYIFLLKKIISFNKINRGSNANTRYLLELHKSCVNIYRYDFNALFDITEYIIINLINGNPTEAINYIQSIIDDNLFPNFFIHIFYYYLGVYIIN